MNSVHPLSLTKPTRLAHLTAILLLGMFFWLGMSSSVMKSATFDEPAHLTAGYSYWLSGDFRLNPQNGLLPQLLAALPLLDDELRFPSLDSPAWKQRDVWTLSQAFFYDLGNDTEAMLRQGRAIILLLGVVLGAGLYLWSLRLHGPGGALFSLSLFVFCPNILAHSQLITSDIAFSLCLLLAMASLWWLYQRLTWLRLLVGGLCLGLLALAKMSAILVWPMLVLMVAARLRYGPPVLEIRGPLVNHSLSSRLGQGLALGLASLIAGILALGVIWLGHGFHSGSIPTSAYFAWEDQLGHSGLLGTIIRWAKALGLAPQTYLYGLAHTLAYAANRPTFLAGHYGLFSSPWFFPYAVLVKTPMATLLVFLLGILGLVRKRPLTQGSGTPDWYPLLPLLILILVYGGFALTASINIGHRHILPIYPAAFILAGGLWRRFGKWLLPAVALLLWESLSVYPHYLAFFQAAAGGPAQGYRHLVDSSLDWGQDLPWLRQWLDEHPSTQPSYFSYFGTGDPAHHGLRVQRLPGFLDRNRQPMTEPLFPGRYILSATMLYPLYLPPYGSVWTASQRELYLRGSRGEGLQFEDYLTFEALRFNCLGAQLRQRRPEAMIGYSLLVYEVGAGELAAALACEGGGR